MKNNIKKDNSLLPLCRQDTKKGKELRAKMPRHLLIDLRLIVVGLLLLFIIIIIVNSSRTNTKGSQLSRSQRGIGVGDKLEDRDVEELKKQLILLAVNDLLVAPNNLQALLQEIHVLICVPTHSKYASEHLHKAGAGADAGGIRGTTTMSSARRSHRRS
jgi:hypothetical protein